MGTMITDDVEFEQVWKELAGCISNPSAEKFRQYRVDHKGAFENLWDSMQTNQAVAEQTIATLAKEGRTELAMAIRKLGSTDSPLQSTLQGPELKFIEFIREVAAKALDFKQYAPLGNPRRKTPYVPKGDGFSRS